MSCEKTPSYYGPNVPDTAVQYTGDGCDSLGICPNSMLNELLEKIVTLLCAEGTDEPIDVTVNCNYLTLPDKKLKTILQHLLDAICGLNSDVIENTIYIDAKTALNLTGKCITLPTANQLTISNVFQSIIDYVCALNVGTTVSTSTILNTVFGAMTNCQGNGFTITGSGASQKMSFQGRTPIGTYLWGDYNLANYDANGVGKAGTDACGSVLADGRNSTWDMRGMAPVGATTYGSGSLNTLVDPTVNNDVDYTLNPGQVKGKVKVAHTGNNNGPHTHDIPTKQVAISRGETCTITVFDSACDGATTGTKTTASSGMATPVENRQPSRGGIWIKVIA